MTIPIVIVIGLSIPIVKTALIIIMRPIKNSIDTLRLIVGNNASGVIVVVAHSRRDVDAISFVAVERHWGSSSIGREIEAICAISTFGAAWRNGTEVVTVAAMVINDGNDAAGAGAEGVLGSRMNNTTCSQWLDLPCRPIGSPFYLVEWAGIRTVQTTSSAVCSDAGSVSGFSNNRPYAP